MTGLAALARAARACVRCGFCLPACPTYGLLGREPDGPRGRLAILGALARGEVPLTDGARLHLDRCLGCLACETACPSGVPYGQVLSGVRAATASARRSREGLVRRAGLASVGWILAARWRMRLAGGVVRWWSGSWWRRAAVRAGVVARLPAGVRALEALTPGPVAARRVRYVPASRVLPSATPRRLRVGFFQGCVQEELFSAANAAMARVLSRFGCEVVFPAGQGCCGAFTEHLGARARALAAARRNVDAFLAADVEVVVTNAAGCGAALKGYGALLAGDPEYADRAIRFARMVRDAAELLVELPPPPARPVPVVVAYQDPCRAVNVLGIRSQPRTLLGAIPGLELRELEPAERCCGSAGVYGVSQPELSASILAERMEAVRRSGAQAIVTANPGCALHLARGSREAGLQLPVLDLMELLDRAYGDAAEPR